LLVGKTASNSNTVGFQAGQNGFTAITRASGQPLILDRTTTDGAIQDFRKDGTTVGSIGTSTGYTKITSGDGTNGSGLQFGDSKIYPVEANSVVTDNAVDFGDPSYRFKDLYLSGGVYLGGTGAANKLDDYEEGTWTPVPKGGTVEGTFTSPEGHQTGTYTKVGSTVHVSMMLYATSFTGTGDFEIHGLPFTINGSAGTMAVQANSPPWATLSADHQNITAFPAGTKFQFRATSRVSDGGYVTAQCSSSVVGYIRISGSYHTNS